MLCAAEHVGNEPFAVLLGDDFIDRRDPLLSRMIDVRQRYGGSIVALMEVEPDQVSAYGSRRSSRPKRTTSSRSPTWWRSPPRRGAVELDRDRPLCLRPGHLRRAAPDAAGPRRRDPAHRRAADAGHADRSAAADGGGVHGVLFRGRRYDTGNKLDYLRTTVQFACERPDVARSSCPGCAATWTPSDAGGPGPLMTSPRTPSRPRCSPWTATWPRCWRPSAR